MQKKNRNPFFLALAPRSDFGPAISVAVARISADRNGVAASRLRAAAAAHVKPWSMVFCSWAHRRPYMAMVASSCDSVLSADFLYFAANHFPFRFPFEIRPHRFIEGNSHTKCSITFIVNISFSVGEQKRFRSETVIFAPRQELGGVSEIFRRFLGV